MPKNIMRAHCSVIRPDHFKFASYGPVLWVCSALYLSRIKGFEVDSDFVLIYVTTEWLSKPDKKSMIRTLNSAKTSLRQHLSSLMHGNGHGTGL